MDNNDGTLSNGTVFSRGLVGESFRFDGVDDAVWIADSRNLAITDSLTLEAWVYPTIGGGYRQIIFRGDSRPGLDPYYLRFEGDGLVHFQIQFDNIGHFSNLGAPLQLGEWQHVAGTLDDLTGVQALYVNGQLMASTSTDVRPLGPLDPRSSPGVAIGNLEQPNGFQPFAGRIDEAAIYHRALSASEIQAIYDAGPAGKCRPSIFVASIDPFYEAISHKLYSVGTDVTVQDSAGFAIGNATVRVKVVLPDGERVGLVGTSGSNGIATVSLLTPDTGTYAFTVTKVDYPGRTYDPLLNVEKTDSITIS